MSLHEEPPVLALRDLALEAVNNVEIRHKPDRFLSGKLHKDTFYTKVVVDDASVIALRSSLASSLQADADLKAVKKVLREVGDSGLRSRLLESVKEGIAEGLPPQRALLRPEEQLAMRERLSDWARDNKLTVEKARKSITEIVSVDVQRIVGEAFEARIAQGKTPKQALTEPIEHGQYRTGIKKVLVFARNRAVPVVYENRQGQHTKYLVSADYAYMDVCVSDPSQAPDLVPRAIAVLRSDKKRSGWERFFKNDMVRHEDEKGVFVIRKFDNKFKKLICILATETAPNVDYVNKAGGRRDFAGEDLSKLRLVNV